MFISCFSGHKKNTQCTLFSLINTLQIIFFNQVLDINCSPTNRERELGLDRRETGWFYPTDGERPPRGGVCRQQYGVVREELPFPVIPKDCNCSYIFNVSKQ